MPGSDHRLEASGTDSEVVDRYLRAIDPGCGAAGLDDLESLEREFVRSAGVFSRLHGICYGAWIDAGVSPSILAEADIVDV